MRMRTSRRAAFALALITLLEAGCGSSSSAPTSPTFPVVRMSVTAAAAPYVGFPVQLRAVAIQGNGYTYDVTRNVTWTSSTPAVATVSAAGVVDVVAVGHSDIRATLNSEIADTFGLDAVAPPVITGTVTDRIEGGPIDGSSVSFSGPVGATTRVTNGRFQLPLVPGEYDVSIEGPSHVAHRTLSVPVQAGVPLAFSVVRWGSGRFGAVYDASFHQFFHQIARVNENRIISVRKWVIPPREIYLAEGAIPKENFELMRAVIEELTREELPAMWCGFAPRLAVVTGPDIEPSDGQIVVRPNWDMGGTGTLGPTQIRSGVVTMAAFDRTANAVATRDGLWAGFLHEFFHVAFAFHECGGPVGQNPFGFSPGNCPFPDSVMANRGPLIPTLSAQDRLAACIVYHPDTHPGNQLPDTNPSYSTVAGMALRR